MTEFSTHPFLISYIAPKIHDLSDEWIPRLEGKFPFWTLGSASYLDYLGQLNPDKYLKLMREKNDILLQSFPELYRFQLYYFEEMMKAPCRYMENMSLPGFHVFKYHDEFLKPMARPHVDVSFNNYEWGSQVGSEIFTHVVAVEVPKSGASIRVWPTLTAETIARLGASKVRELSLTEDSYLVHHKPDQLVLHSGKVLHRIEPWTTSEPDSWRITLQSHAVKIDGVWELYW